MEDRRGVPEIKNRNAKLRKGTVPDFRAEGNEVIESLITGSGQAGLSLIKEMLEKGLLRGEIKCGRPASDYTSLKIGGPVDIMVFPEDPLSLKNILVAAQRGKIPVFLFGSGTNLLVSDEGVNGIAISLKAFRKVELVRGADDKNAVLFVEAGLPLQRLLNFAGENGYSGVEALAGIPGTFGGAVCMNAGSFGTEIKDVIVSVALMKSDGKIVIKEKNELEFSYRNSKIPDGAIILSANIVLKKDSPKNVSARVNEFLKKKRQKQPLEELSAGCVFKNPVRIDLPTGKAGSYREGDSAGKLIDMAGCKGMRIGDVEVSVMHANFFINKGKTTCKDFIELMEAVKERVKESSGIVLEPEIKIIGKNLNSSSRRIGTNGSI